jgi:hypothetical protein
MVLQEGQRKWFLLAFLGRVLVFELVIFLKEILKSDDLLVCGCIF